MRSDHDEKKSSFGRGKTEGGGFGDGTKWKKPGISTDIGKNKGERTQFCKRKS